ncbi:MAG: ATP-binding protein [Campylobacterota bacterium]|nr:ATP-binding protein [Campylobacterota bacterium]
MQKLLTLFLFFITTALLLQASPTYQRKIVVSSFATQADAERALNRLEKHLQRDAHIMELHDQWKFESITKESDNYFIVLVEPFFDREVLQDVIDHVRILYQDAYVKRIPLKQSVPKTVELDQTVVQIPEKQLVAAQPIEKTDTTAIEAEPVTTLVEAEAVATAIEAKPVQPSSADIAPKSSTKPLTKHVVSRDKPVAPTADSPDFFWPFSGTLLALIIALIIIFRSRQKNRELSRRYMLESEACMKSENLMNQKDMFFAKISHELRTPMNAIIGLSHIVLQSKLSQTQSENVSKIKYSGELLLEIINDILDISKISAGELKVEKVEFNINDVLDHVSNVASLGAHEKNLELIFSVEQGVPSKFVGDPLRLGQILINLLSNAVKFTKAGEINLRVHKSSQSDNTINLGFKVSDTGIGMTSAQMEKLFKSFSQVDDSTSRLYGGTGLGLSISKQLVEIMGGTIDVESKFGKGSSFIFNLAFELTDQTNKRHYRLPNKTLMQKRVLIVDTNSKTVDLLTKMLTYFHYEVRHFPILEEAESLLLDTPLDIVFIDENCITEYTADKIKAIKEQAAIKVVVIKELYHQNGTDLVELNDVDHYLLKPFNQQSIFNTILDLYGEERAKYSKQTELTANDLKVLSGRKILVAEDNDINQRVLSGLLQGSGLELIFAENGRVAIDKLHSEDSIDLVLMDISMPVMDGYEATTLIREEHIYDEIPIVALTANTMTDELDHAVACGMQGYIAKPLDVQLLYGKLLELIPVSTAEQALPIEGAKSIDNLSTKPKSTPDIQNSEVLMMSEGLERCGGDRTLFEELLQDFSNMYKDSVSKLESICTEKRHKDGKKFAHEIKGVSANIGADALSRSAVDLEEAFKRENQSNYPLLIKNYDEKLKRLLQEIATLASSGQ